MLLKGILSHSILSAAGGDVYMYDQMWDFNAILKAPLIAGTLDSTDGITTGSPVLTDTSTGVFETTGTTLKCSTGGGTNNLTIVDTGGVTTTFGMILAHASLDLSVTNGDWHAALNYQTSNVHARPPGFTAENSGYIKVNAASGQRFTKSLSNKYHIIVLLGGFGTNYRPHPELSKANSTNGGSILIKSDTGSEFTSWTLICQNVKQWGVLQTTTYASIDGRGTGIEVSGVSLPDPALNTFDAALTGSSVVDLFVDTGSTALTAHTMNQGGLSWANGNFAILSGGTNSECTTIGEEAVDMSISDIIGNLYFETHATKTDEIKLVFRWVDANNHWFVSIIPGTGVALKKIVSGTSTTLASSGTTVNASTKYHVQIACWGTANYNIGWNDAQLISYTTNDTAHSTATKHGIGDAATSNAKFINIAFFPARSSDYDVFDTVISEST